MITKVNNTSLLHKCPITYKSWCVEHLTHALCDPNMKSAFSYIELLLNISKQLYYFFHSHSIQYF